MPRPCPSSLLLICKQSVMPVYFLPRPLPSLHPIFIISFLAYSDYTFLLLIPELLRIRSLYFSAIVNNTKYIIINQIIIKLFECQLLIISDVAIILSRLTTFYLYLGIPYYIYNLITNYYFKLIFSYYYLSITTIISMLTRSDPANFRQTIFCAIIAEQNIILEDINMRRNPPGLKPEQSKFLQLVEAVTNGSKMIVAKGGTHMRFYAGMVTNNEGVQFDFDCGLHRSIGYFLQYLLLISMFGKNSLSINLQGITNDNHDNSVDSIQQHLIPLLKQYYQFDNELSIKIVKRGYFPDGGGLVHVSIPTVRKLKRVNLEQKGYIKRVRGICSGSQISSSILNNVKDQVKTAFLDYLPDIWIYTDFYKGDKASLSPGYSLTLKAQTTTGSILTFDAAYQGEKTEQFVKKTVDKFMDEINYCGIISTNYQWFILTLMALSEKKTSSTKIGRVSPFTIECLRILRDFFGITFQISQSKTDKMAVFRCLGIGYQNYARIMK